MVEMNFVMKLRCVHSIHSQWKSKRKLATYMRRMRNNSLKIRIAGSSCSPQSLFQERIKVQRVKRSVQSLGYVNFIKVIFRPIKPLKLIGSWFPERSAYQGSLSCLGDAVARGLDGRLDEHSFTRDQYAHIKNGCSFLSPLYSSSLWRTHTVVVSKLNKPPVYIKPSRK